MQCSACCAEHGNAWSVTGCSTHWSRCSSSAEIAPFQLGMDFPAEGPTPACTHHPGSAGQCSQAGTDRLQWRGHSWRCWHSQGRSPGSPAPKDPQGKLEREQTENTQHRDQSRGGRGKCVTFWAPSRPHCRAHAGRGRLLPASTAQPCLFHGQRVSPV